MKPPTLPVLPTGRRLLYWLLGVAVLTALGWAIVGDISPAPPRSLAMTTGVPDGAYHRFGERYQEILRANGIRLELRPSSGGVENLQRLNEGTVSVGFVQGGTGLLAQDPDAPPEATPLRSLATVAFEPVWIFSTAIDLSSGLGPLAGKRIAVGVPGSGNFKVATELLAVYGVTDGGAPATRFVSEGGMAAADLLTRGEVDAAIMIAAPEAPAVQRLLADSSVRLASLDHVQGLARRFPFFQPVTLKRGSVDPKRDLPPQDIQLLATTANLVVRDELHPALAYLLLEAARQVHRQPSIISRPGEFPSPTGTDFPLSTQAERYFKNGRPFLQNYLPFWAANYAQRLLLLLVPLAAILVPLVRVLPELIGWRRRSRLYRRYGELKFLEQDLASRKLDDEERREARAQLDRIEEEVVQTKFPLDFTDRVYTLRQHVDYVRAQLRRQSEPDAKD
ncbi:TAXI family TRAP transporter solute-binding subunit [Variovorax ginsengisoli]|uniref:TAXI family TRAP transporter solute-binding subunit n=1 Tax=Variovorax ginsengisoli TaxID=363844 RepID=A0ABT8S0I4_9BURK|nr:TAXI family TRAP transporter solute-binding subunit [Variovorax ginsengisoli]MDN8613266.1 TAXI family TRAP transporter solute-binding subunit [Variovorax ginsengisoli]MDO1532436.1 TAXI family TRAP transporter solute-binding subunit [Variovorax ginsengisoli]